MSDSFTAAADKEYRYPVLTREGAVQILVRPTANDLRGYAEQGWNLVRAIVNPSDAWRQLLETLRTAVPDPDERIGGRDPEASWSRLPKPDAGGLYLMDLDAWCDCTLD